MREIVRVVATLLKFSVLEEKALPNVADASWHCHSFSTSVRLCELRLRRDFGQVKFAAYIGGDLPTVSIELFCHEHGHKACARVWTDVATELKGSLPLGPISAQGCFLTLNSPNAAMVLWDRRIIDILWGVSWEKARSDIDQRRKFVCK